MDRFSNILVDALALLLIILVAPKRNKRPANAEFAPVSKMALALVSVYTCDIIAAAISGLSFPFAIGVSYFVNTMYFLAQTLYALTWLSVVVRLGNLDKKALRILRIVSFSLLSFEALLVITNLFTHWFFVISEDNIYSRAEYYPWMLLPFLPCFMLAVTFVLINLAKPGDKAVKSRAIMFVSYLCLPAIGGGLSIIIPNLPWLWSLATVSLLLVEICIQQQAIGESALNEAIGMMRIVFYKIIEMDLTADTYRIIESDLPDSEFEYGPNTKISVSSRIVTESDVIYPDDLDYFKRNTDLCFLRKYFEGSQRILRIKYRRKTAQDFRWVATEFLKHPGYTPEKQLVMMYVRDINDEFTEELKQSKQLEFNVNHDMLTGLRSHRCYGNRLSELSASHEKVGILYADLNNLKNVNDTLGHGAGDLYIKSFADMLSDIFGSDSSYRISGDEFTVMAENTDKDSFETDVFKLAVRLAEKKVAIASFGAVWCDDSSGISAAFREAEDMMYKNKDEFYLEHTELERRKSR